MIDIDAIDKLHHATVPTESFEGPWRTVFDDPDDPRIDCGSHSIATLPPDEYGEENAALIVAIRNAWPELSKEMRMLRDRDALLTAPEEIPSPP